MRDERMEEREIEEMREDDQKDEEMRDMEVEEMKEVEKRIEVMEKDVKIMIIKKDEEEEKNEIIEIREGKGGMEDEILEGDMLRMYERYEDEKGWRVEIVQEREGDEGGYKEIIEKVQGKGVL